MMLCYWYSDSHACCYGHLRKFRKLTSFWHFGWIHFNKPHSLISRRSAMCCPQQTNHKMSHIYNAKVDSATLHSSNIVFGLSCVTNRWSLLYKKLTSQDKSIIEKPWRTYRSCPCKRILSRKSFWLVISPQILPLRSLWSINWQTLGQMRMNKCT